MYKIFLSTTFVATALTAPSLQCMENGPKLDYNWLFSKERTQAWLLQQQALRKPRAVKATGTSATRDHTDAVLNNSSTDGVRQATNVLFNTTALAKSAAWRATFEQWLEAEANEKNPENPLEGYKQFKN